MARERAQSKCDRITWSAKTCPGHSQKTLEGNGESLKALGTLQA